MNETISQNEAIGVHPLAAPHTADLVEMHGLKYRELDGDEMVVSARLIQEARRVFHVFSKYEGLDWHREKARQMMEKLDGALAGIRLD